MTTDQRFSWPSVRPEVKAPPPPPSFEELERQVRAKAHEAGLAAGLEAGRAQVASELADQRRRLAALIELLEAHQLRLSETDAQRISAFILAAFEALLGQVATVTPEVFAQVLRRALEAMPAETDTVIRVHPSLVADVDRELGRVVVPDPTLEPFGMAIDGGAQNFSVQPLTEFRQLLAQGLTDGG
ncbi:MAG: FliH/SctL family protein [Pseudomonadales bacterium]